MPVQTVYDCMVYNRAKWKLEPGEILVDCLDQTVKENDPDRYERIMRWWDVQSKITFLRENLSRASNRYYAKEITVTLDELFEIGEKQNWKCAYTGVPLEFTRGGSFGHNTNPNSCTIDRIRSYSGYTSYNVQLITWKANCAKNAMTHDEFIDLCRTVVQNCQ